MSPVGSALAAPINELSSRELGTTVCNYGNGYTTTIIGSDCPEQPYHQYDAGNSKREDNSAELGARALGTVECQYSATYKVTIVGTTCPTYPPDDP